MRIMIIRHGDPDNVHKTLTKQGFLEAEALHDYYKNYDFFKVYSSPLERAKITADILVKDHDNQVEVMPWLKEFTHLVKVPYSSSLVQNWDFLPSYFSKNGDLVSQYYLSSEVMESGKIKDDYKMVIDSFDDILKQHGYSRDGKIYKAVNPNTNTIVFVCHFGMMSVLLSHIFNIPYTILSQYMCCPPSGVTTLVSEEREEGIVQFRMLGYGDISHLALKGYKPSFHGRFCEVFTSKDRH